MQLNPVSTKKRNRFIGVALLALALSGCVGDRYFETRSVQDLNVSNRRAAREFFERGEKIALMASGPGWYGKSPRVEVWRQFGDRKIAWQANHNPVPDGKAALWTFNLPPGKYRASVFDGDQHVYDWDFTVLN